MLTGERDGHMLTGERERVKKDKIGDESKAEIRIKKGYG